LGRRALQQAGPSEPDREGGGEKERGLAAGELPGACDELVEILILQGSGETIDMIGDNVDVLRHSRLILVARLPARVMKHTRQRP
jgi:hypothetical protein